MAMGQNNLFMALTPQAALAAVQQEAGAHPGLMSNQDFAAGFDGNFSNLYGMAYYSKDAFLKDGYGVTSMLCSAMSNGVRSRQDVTRDAGLIMPTYHELIANTRPTITLSRLEANGDLVSRMETDPSMIVGLTRTVGSLVSNPLLLAVMGAGFVGATQSSNVIYMQPSPEEW